MGWTYRKSIGLGPFRINVSKSGIAYSVGGGGFRMGVNSRGRSYKSVSIPGTGMRYYGSSKQGCLSALVLLVAMFSGIASLTAVFLLRMWP
jgi:isocitrate dehydrogenase